MTAGRALIVKRERASTRHILRFEKPVWSVAWARTSASSASASAALTHMALAPRDRKSIESALLRYCELDTLAMVMAVQAWTQDLDP